MPQTVNCGFANADRLATYGPSLLVQIGFDPNYRRGLKPVLASPGYQALIDTGASETCIDSSVARSLNLPVVDVVDISGIHGSAHVNIHLAQVYVPGLNFTTSGRFAGVHLHASGQPFGALLGRSFLRYVRLVYDGIAGEASIAHPD